MNENVHFLPNTWQKQSILTRPLGNNRRCPLDNIFTSGPVGKHDSPRIFRPLTTLLDVEQQKWIFLFRHWIHLCVEPLKTWQRDWIFNRTAFAPCLFHANSAHLSSDAFEKNRLLKIYLPVWHLTQHENNRIVFQTASDGYGLIWRCHINAYASLCNVSRKRNVIVNLRICLMESYFTFYNRFLLKINTVK